MKKTWALFLASLFILNPSAKANEADDKESDDKKVYSNPSPGNTGSNAFTILLDPVTDAAITDSIVLDFNLSRANGAMGDKTDTLRFSVEIPFGTWASLNITSMYESWKLDNPTLPGSKNKEGSGFGEVGFVAKFRVLEESKNRPAVALKVGFKSAAGARQDRRFTDSMGAVLGFLASKNVYESEEAFIKKIRIMAELAFAVWDDGADENGFTTQNDALRFGLGVEVDFAKRFTARLSTHGIIGYRDNGDQPVLLVGEIEYRLTRRSSWVVGGDVGLTDDAEDSRVYTAWRLRF